jgi:hypothetical protein
MFCRKDKRGTAGHLPKLNFTLGAVAAVSEAAKYGLSVKPNIEEVRDDGNECTAVS